MEEKKDYIRVRAQKFLRPDKDIIFRDENGPKFSDEFMTKLYDEDATFREPIITFINDAVGTHTWGIQFAEFIEEKSFDVNIYCADKEAYYQIVDIIRERIKRYELIYHHSGTLQDYIGSQ